MKVIIIKNFIKFMLVLYSSVLFAQSTSTPEIKNHNHFDYQHQESWQFLSGDHQSPINIDTAQLKIMKDKGDITLYYSDFAKFENNNGHSIQVDDSGFAVLNGRSFELQQFHFHAPSEHTVNGKNYPLEVHFVNKAQSGRFAVVSVFLKEGKYNKGFQDVLDNIDNKATDEKPIHIDVNDMLPSNITYYHYLGSLTTPPLIENVEWYILAHPAEISKEQLEVFHKYYKGNNRKINPLGDRVVLLHNQ